MEQKIQTINREQFIRRLVNLCLRSGLGGMPKDELDQHILLKSAALLMRPGAALTEKTVNETLQVWLDQVCAIKNFDRVTLRRWMVDAGYLARTTDGTSYQVAQPANRPGLFDAEVDQVDVAAEIAHARDAMERKKQAFLAQQRPR